jgi:hypothetical protein
LSDCSNSWPKKKKKAFVSNPNDDNSMNPSIEMAYGKRKKSSHSKNGFEIICLAMNRV